MMSARRPTRSLLARIVTEALAPAWIATALLVAVAIHTAPTPAEAIRWGVVSALFASVLPFLYVVYEVRRRRVTDRHVSVRTQRPVPMLIAAGSILLGVAILVLGGAPRALVALVVAMLAGVLVTLVITLRWKISVHSATLAGAVVIVVLVFGIPFLPLVALCALVGWARVEVGAHTPRQVVIGEAVGAVIAGAVFTALR